MNLLRDGLRSLLGSMTFSLYEKVADIVKSAGFAELRRRFDERHPDYSHLADTKKLDLLLWQYRQGHGG